MIAKLLTDISNRYFTSDDGRQALLRYEELTKHPGWKVHQAFILEIANAISSFMLSKEYTKLDMQEKDAQQRAFFVSKEIIEFLLDPLKGARRLAQMQKLNQQEATRRKRPQGDMKHG